MTCKQPQQMMTWQRDIGLQSNVQRAFRIDKKTLRQAMLKNRDLPRLFMFFKIKNLIFYWHFEIRKWLNWHVLNWERKLVLNVDCFFHYSDYSPLRAFIILPAKNSASTSNSNNSLFFTFFHNHSSNTIWFIFVKARGFILGFIAFRIWAHIPKRPQFSVIARRNFLKYDSSKQPSIKTCPQKLYISTFDLTFFLNETTKLSLTL